MNKNILIAVVLILVLGGAYFAYVQNSNQSMQDTTAIPTVDPEGNDRDVYVGKTPCADCPGIDVKLAIKENGKYRMTSVYIDRDVDPLIEKGTWAEETKAAAGNPSATVLTLTSSDGNKTYFLVTTSGVTQLDENMQPVNNPYAMNLTKKR